MFSNYPCGLDANDTNNGQNGRYTIAELFSNNTERPFPFAKLNSPPGINYTTTHLPAPTTKTTSSARNPSSSMPSTLAASSHQTALSSQPPTAARNLSALT